jgi:DNA-binding MarR family transcriptional regulator
MAKIIQKYTMEATKRSVLQLIASSTENCITDQQIADQLGVSLDESCYHLDELDRGGFIKLIRSKLFGNPEARRRALSVTPQGKMVLEGKISFEDVLNSSSNPQVFNINNHAPVATQQLGNNNTANVTQNIGSDTTEILQMLQALRQEVSSLPPENQTTAIEALDDIEEEVKTPTRASRIRGGLLALWSVVKDITSFANAVTALAQRFHLDHLLS